MKKLTKLFFLLAAMAVLFTFFSCSSGSSSDDNNIALLFFMNNNSEDNNDSSNSNSSATSCTITFDANGGSLTSDKQTISLNVQTNLEKASSLNLKRDGYIFKGWARYSTATTIEIEDGGSITASSDMILYAIWAYEATYTVSFNANGGSLTTSSQSVSGETITGALTASIKTAELLGLERGGFIFKGWAKSSTATSVVIKDGETVTISENTILYAIWACNVEYTVFFNANGGTVTTSSQAVSGETIDGSLTAALKTATSIGLSRSGYKFKGWATSNSASVVLYTDGTKITLSGNVTLYALWDKIVSYTITYDANGGSMSSSSQTVTGTESEGATAKLYSASRSGYIFSGWSTSSYASSAQYSSGATITIKSNIVLYAVWSLPQYTITYIVDSQSYGQLRAPQVKKTITGEQTITLPTVSSLGYSKNGYEFLGWKTSQSSSSYYPAGSSIKISRDTTLYAAWKELYIYVYLYHPGYSTASRAKFGTMAVSIGSVTKTFSISMQNGSYTSSKVKMSGVSGSNAWATSFQYQKTGSKATAVSQSGYMNFVNGATYKINVYTGVVTKI